MWRVFYSVSPRTPEGGQAGKGDRPPSLHILRSRETHTQLLLATSKRGNVASHLFGKPPNPRRGTSWKKVTNLTPITYYVLAGHIPSCCWLPQRGGMWRVIYSVSPRTPEGGQAGKEDKPPLLYILCSRETHTQLLLATSKRGNVGAGKRL